MLLLWHFAQRTDGIWYQGGLAAYALLTSLVVLAAVRPDGVVRTALGFRPLMALGIISYGAYLIHWPVFVFVDHARTGLSQWPLFMLRIAITIVLAVVVVLRHRAAGALEAGRDAEAAHHHPDRVRVGDHDGVRDLAARADAGHGSQRVARAVRETAGRPDAAAVTRGKGPELAMYGDSTALVLSLGLGAWTDAHPNVLREEDGFADLGCGLLQIPRRIDGVDGRVRRQLQELAGQVGRRRDQGGEEGRRHLAHRGRTVGGRRRSATRAHRIG